MIFANAGVARLAPFGTVDEKFFDFHFNANVKGLFFSVQKGIPFMNDGVAQANYLIAPQQSAAHGTRTKLEIQGVRIEPNHKHPD